MKRANGKKPAKEKMVAGVVMVSEDEQAGIQMVAMLDGVTPAEWARGVLVREAIHRLRTCPADHPVLLDPKGTRPEYFR